VQLARSRPPPPEEEEEAEVVAPTPLPPAMSCSVTCTIHPIGNIVYFTWCSPFCLILPKRLIVGLKSVMIVEKWGKSGKYDSWFVLRRG
jgi:hypothetical protein